jgi:cell division protein FtsW
LTIKQEQIDDFKQAFIPILFPVVLTAVLIAPENLSTAAIFFFTSVFVMFIGRIAIKHILLLVGVSGLVAGLFLLLLFVLPDTLLERQNLNLETQN